MDGIFIPWWLCPGDGHPLDRLDNAKRALASKSAAPAVSKPDTQGDVTYEHVTETDHRGVDRVVEVIRHKDPWSGSRIT